MSSLPTDDKPTFGEMFHLPGRCPMCGALSSKIFPADDGSPLLQQNYNCGTVLSRCRIEQGSDCETAASLLEAQRVVGEFIRAVEAAVPAAINLPRGLLKRAKEAALPL